jgi:hypothetical protein
MLGAGFVAGETGKGMKVTTMVIEGKDQEAEQPLLVRILMLMLLRLLLMPWVLMAGGLLLVGIGSFFRKDWEELRICLPAGIALTAAIVGGFWLWLRSPRWIYEFRYAEDFLEFVTKPGEPPVMKDVIEIADVSEFYQRRTAGYLIRFRDGTRIALNRRVPYAGRLYAALQQDIAAGR